MQHIFMYEKPVIKRTIWHVLLKNCIALFLGIYTLYAGTVYGAFWLTSNKNGEILDLLLGVGVIAITILAIWGMTFFTKKVGQIDNAVTIPPLNEWGGKQFHLLENKQLICAQPGSTHDERYTRVLAIGTVHSVVAYRPVFKSAQAPLAGFDLEPTRLTFHTDYMSMNDCRVLIAVNELAWHMGSFWDKPLYEPFHAQFGNAHWMRQEMIPDPRID